ncbi:ribonuclease H-like domain-containing protein, partial [Schizophyllum commune]
MSFPLSYVRSRRLFPFASLPATVRAFYAVNMAHANALLSAHFPSTGPGSNFDVISFDIEYTGRKESDSSMSPRHIPLPRGGSHFLRLLTIARDGVVIVFDLLALGEIPPRIIEIFRNRDIIKVGIKIKGDAVLVVRHYAIPVYNGWELSQLWKCMHPSVEVAPLTTHISLDDMARLTLGVRVNKVMQTSNWASPVLTQEQIEYAILDAYILLPMFRVVVQEYVQGLWPHFSQNAFAFNVDIVDNGAVVQPGATTIGRHIRVWGVNEPVPSTASGDWAPRHHILDAYNAAIWS